MKLISAFLGALCIAAFAVAQDLSIADSDDLSLSWASDVASANEFTMSEDDKEISYAAVEAAADQVVVEDHMLSEPSSADSSEYEDELDTDEVSPLVVNENENENSAIAVDADSDNEAEADEENEDLESASARMLKGKKKHAKYAAPMKAPPMMMKVAPMPMPSKKGSYNGYPSMSGYNYYGGYNGMYGNGGYYRRALKEYAPVVAPVRQVPTKPVVADKASYRPVRQNYVVETVAKPVAAVVPVSVHMAPASYTKISESYKGVNAATRRYLHGKKKHAKKNYGKGKQTAAPMKVMVAQPVQTGKGGYNYGGYGYNGYYGNAGYY